MLSQPAVKHWPDLKLRAYYEEILTRNNSVFEHSKYLKNSIITGEFDFVFEFFNHHFKILRKKSFACNLISFLHGPYWSSLEKVYHCTFWAKIEFSQLILQFLTKKGQFGWCCWKKWFLFQLDWLCSNLLLVSWIQQIASRDINSCTY